MLVWNKSIASYHQTDCDTFFESFLGIVFWCYWCSCLKLLVYNLLCLQFLLCLRIFCYVYNCGGWMMCSYWLPHVTTPTEQHVYKIVQRLIITTKKSKHQQLENDTIDSVETSLNPFRKKNNGACTTAFIKTSIFVKMVKNAWFMQGNLHTL